jgi:hypothetical protein
LPLLFPGAFTSFVCLVALVAHLGGLYHVRREPVRVLLGAASLLCSTVLIGMLEVMLGGGVCAQHRWWLCKRFLLVLTAEALVLTTQLHLFVQIWWLQAYLWLAFFNFCVVVIVGVIFVEQNFGAFSVRVSVRRAIA